MFLCPSLETCHGDLLVLSVVDSVHPGKALFHLLLDYKLFIVRRCLNSQKHHFFFLIKFLPPCLFIGEFYLIQSLPGWLQNAGLQLTATLQLPTDTLHLVVKQECLPSHLFLSGWLINSHFFQSLEFIIVLM